MFFQQDKLNRSLLTQNIDFIFDFMFFRDAGEEGAGGQLPCCLLIGWARGRQSALFIEVPLKPAISNNQIDLY